MHKIPQLTVVYGGQYGSEGKGQVLAAIVRDDDPQQAFAVRVGGPNAGHTACFADGKLHAVQSIPVPAFTHPGIIPVIGAGGMINLKVLHDEMRLLREMRDIMNVPATTPLLIVDPKTAIVTDAHIEEEEEANMQKGIGSTCEGVGAALADKIRRRGALVASDVAHTLKAMGAVLRNTVGFLNRSDAPIYVEGTQGYLLSIHTSGHYPFVTSRQCGPLGILADIGLNPRATNDYRSVCVFRTFPIRVGGNSGDLKDEITWEQLKEMSGGYVQTPEITTVTKRQRRIGQWDADRNYRTIMETRPTEVALTFLDYLYPKCAKATCRDELAKEATTYLGHRQRELATTIDYVSTAPGQQHTFTRFDDTFDDIPF